MKKAGKFIINFLPLIIAILLGAGIVYAATSGSATGGGTVTQFTTNTGDCRRITNNNSNALFIPANTTAEWNAFLNNAPNKTIASCCVGNVGQSCTSGANSCGQTNSGTIQCNGSCSASTPANPPGYGNSCQSAPNSCGQRNTGTIQCNGSCSATTPSESGCQSCKYLPPYGGASCEDVYNSSGGNYCPGIECSGGPGMGCTANGGFSCSNYGNSASCNPWVTCDWF